MPRLRTLASIILLGFVSSAHAADVFVPPVLKGVKGDGKARRERPVPFPAEDENWSLVRSRNYVFISSASEKKTREVAEDLENLAAALSRLNPQFRMETVTPTRVVIFNRRREAQPYFDLLLDRENANVSGVYVAQKHGGSMIMDLSSSLRSERTPFHELVHNLIANGGANLPLWLDEGLAEYFSNAVVRNGSIRAGGPVRAHVATMQRRQLIPLATLFRVVRESDAYNLPEGQRGFYAQSWGVVDWLMYEGGPRQEKFYLFLDDISRGISAEDALTARYGKTLEDMRRGLERLGGFGLMSHSLTIPVSSVDTSTTTTTLDRSQILYELGRFLMSVHSNGVEAERHFRAALEANPKHARSIAALGELRAAGDQPDEALRLFERAIRVDPRDAGIHLTFAETLMGTQIGTLAEANEVRDEDIPNFRKARQLVQTALALGTPELGRAYGDLGTSYVIEDDPAAGIAALEKARTLSPGRLDYAIHLFAMYRRTADRAKADPLFTILDAARNPHVSYAARTVIMRVELGRANTFVKESRLADAAAVIRALASDTADLDARADLERQASELARVAEQNRQIEIYNKAIGQVNSGDYKTAMKTLKKLLSTATDEAIIRDAKKLQQKLAARLKSS